MIPGVALHIRQRRVDGRPCFLEDSDYFVYLSNMRELASKTGCSIHAYCLMTNHIHVLLTPSNEASCAELMRDLGQRYVSYFNRRYKRTGTLWEGRFRSCLVDSREYVLSCYRYIERNPVRARMVAAPAAYPWSSYRANIGDVDDPFLSAHAEFTALNEDGAARSAVYRSFCAGEEREEFLAAVREATDGGLPLAGDLLKSQLLASGWRIERGKPGPRASESARQDEISGQLAF